MVEQGGVRETSLHGWSEYGSLDSVWRCVYLALISFPPLGILPHRYKIMSTYNCIRNKG